MNHLSISDEPVTNPNNDLLDARVRAETLASHVIDIPAPFTIGIYGQWGEGKTSFVELLQRYLNEIASGRNLKPIKFITFSAWGHNTSDAVWRALILKIAQEMYGVPRTSAAGDSPNEAPSETEEAEARADDGLSVGPGGHRPWVLRLMNYLNQDAYILREAPPPEDPLKDYKDIVARLDRTAAASVSKDSQRELQLNNEVALLAIVQAAVSAMGVLSPLVNALRDLFKAGDKVDLQELLQKNKSEATREMIQSVEEFKREFCRLFKTKASPYHQVYVFVDDLDRCMPNVALDVLEAIRIFLGVEKCMFIVAADEQLIGEGLKMRFKDIMGGALDPAAVSYVKQKGMEYFEKIIQLHVRVPRRGPRAAHRYIAAQFPAWVAATDIIQIAAGTNPRRLKQHCHQLSYQQMVARTETQVGVSAEKSDRQNGDPEPPPPPDPDGLTRIFEHLVRIYNWSPDCLECLRRMARQPNYRTEMSTLEQWVRKPEKDRPGAGVEQELPEGPCYQLYCDAVRSGALDHIFDSGREKLSTVEPSTLAVLSDFADVAPDPDPGAILKTTDGVFQRILEPFKSSVLSTEKELLQRGVAKLITIKQDYASLWADIPGLALTHEWATTLREVENRLAQAAAPAEVEIKETGNGNGGKADGEGVRAILKHFKGADLERFDELKRILSASPRLSWVLPEEVRLFVAEHVRLRDPQDLLTDSLKSLAGAPGQQLVTRAQMSSLVAKDFVDKLPPERWNDIRDHLRIKKEMLLHFWRTRQLAKLDALEQGWPELAQELRADVTRLQEMERQLLDPGMSAATQDALKGKYIQGDDLVALLRLRPYFKDFDPRVLEVYFKAAQAVAKPAVAAEAAGGQPKVILPPQEEARAKIADLLLRIEPVGSPVGVGDDEVHEYRLVVEYAGKQPAETVVKLKLAELEKLLSSDNLTYSYNTRSGDRAAPGATTRDIALGQQGDLNAQLKAMGQVLFNKFFPKGTGVESLFVDALRSADRLRVVLQSDDHNQRVTRLPWESLYVPAIKNFPALLTRYSFVRLLEALHKIDRVPFAAPLRILAMLSSPSDVPPLNVEKEREILIQVLRPAVTARAVVLEFCEPANLPALREKLPAFRPHIFHFVGHGVFDPSTQKGSLMFEDEQRRGELVGAEILRSALTEYGIQIAVFNSCDTGTASTQDVITGVAGALVSDGIAACIATSRPIVDDAALLFSREFYRSLVTGYSLEGALSEARRALRQEGHDWAAYSLFANSTDLDDMGLDFLRGQEPQGQFEAQRGEANRAADQTGGNGTSSPVV